MHHTRTLALALMATTLLVTAGCASSRSNVTVQESTKISKGQELNDLIRAKQAGALTDDEFESLRHTIMKRPN